MDNLIQLAELDLFTWLITGFMILAAIIAGYEIISKFSAIINKPIGAAKQKKADHELLLKHTQILDEIKSTHDKDKKNLENSTDKLEKLFADFMTEMRSVVSETQNTMQQYSENRVNDRQVSIEREKRLNDRIDKMVCLDESRDSAIDKIGEKLAKLTDMFIDKQINDYRWEIINFASNVVAEKPCNKDAYIHCFKTYEKYEKVLEENGLENGEVEISMEIINESYKQKMLEGF